MGGKKRIVIAEDHTIIRQGLKALLASDKNLEIIGEAVDGLQAIRQVERDEPDLLLLDLNMPRMDGISVIKDLKKRYPEVKIVALTMHKNEEYILSSFRSGVDGYCLKSSSHEELMLAIRVVLNGKRYVDPEVSDKILEGYLEGKKTIKQKTSWDSITSREREVLKLVAEGHNNNSIADLLCISKKTVEKHRANIMEKLDLHTAAALTAYSIEKGLIVRKS